jgi:predicted regulator of Ras-like GTPase activity (Roadblock/LC7/MglB family)
MSIHFLSSALEAVETQVITLQLKLEEEQKMAISTEKLGNILQSFVSSTNDVQGAAVVTPDGLPLAASLPGGMDEERASAMSAAMLSLGERIGGELARGAIDRIYVEGDKGYGILTSCGEDAVFLVLASQTAKQGLLLLEIKRALAELKAILT